MTLLSKLFSNFRENFDCIGSFKPPRLLVLINRTNALTIRRCQSTMKGKLSGNEMDWRIIR